MFEWGRAVCYSGYREGQSPLTCTYPTYEQIVEDIKIIDENGFKYIRMYDPISYAEMTCQVIKDLGVNIKLMLGPGLISEVNNLGCPWMQKKFSEEELKERAAHPDVINAVSVGNENTPSWGANNVPVERLIEFAERLREGTGKPVTFNEGAFEWESLDELAKHLDIISVHSYPLWYGNTVEEALEVNKTWYNKIKEIYPDKFVLFSEVGWATDCADFSQMKEGQANEENQKKYYDEFWEWADREKIIAYMFEAFDEPWKGGKGANEAEKNWGMYKVDRTPKFMLQ